MNDYPKTRDYKHLVKYFFQVTNIRITSDYWHFQEEMMIQSQKSLQKTIKFNWKIVILMKKSGSKNLWQKYHEIDTMNQFHKNGKVGQSIKGTIIDFSKFLNICDQYFLIGTGDVC